MESIIIICIEKFSYIGVLFLIAIENIFPPIPSEVILAFSGFIAKPLNLNIPLIIISSTLGSIIGALILYFFGSKLSNKLNASSSIKFFQEKGIISILICRFIPILRSLISIPAGMSEMPLTKFSLYTFTGSLIWNTVLILVGAKLKDSWNLAIEIIDKYKYIVIVAFALILIILGVKLIIKKNRGIKNGKRL